MSKSVGKTIMELIAEEYFGPGHQNGQTPNVTMKTEPADFDDEEQVQTGDVCDDDKGKIKSLLGELKCELNVSSEEIQLSKAKEEQIFDKPRPVTNNESVKRAPFNRRVFNGYAKHRDNIPITNKSYYVHTQVFLNKCIIDERYFNFSLFRTPMNDRAGPYFIDKREVSVDVYQAGLQKNWNPTQVVHELCSLCQWHPPVFVLHDHTLHNGYHFGVTVGESHFVPADRGANKKLAKHHASTFFLHFLGFRFQFNNGKQVAIHFRDALDKRRFASFSYGRQYYKHTYRDGKY